MKLTLEHLAELWESYRPSSPKPVQSFQIGDRLFDFNRRPSIMGVINLSPESWYRESVCLTTEMALQRGRLLDTQGADLIDVGAESTLGHAARLDDATQQSKLLPVVRGLSQEGIPISVETYRPTVTEACLAAGAKVLNLTGTSESETFFRMVAQYDAALILCYVEGPNVREAGDFDLTQDPIEKMYDYFARRIESATQHGVHKILIDPGLGFYYRNLQDSAARVRHQIRIFLQSFRLRALGFPVVHALPHAFEFFGDEVRTAEPVFSVLAALGGTDLFRTHEVPKIKAVLETLDTYEEQPESG